MPFHSIDEAEQRLKNPQPLTEQETMDLLPWMHMLSGGGSRARLETHLSVRNARAIQVLNETSAKIEGAVRRMDEGSTKLGIAGFRLNIALFVLTVIGIGLAAFAAWIADKSYKDANTSSLQQQQTLDASRKSLESASQALNQLTALTEQQRRQWADYQKQTLAKPDFAFDFWFLNPPGKNLKKLKFQSILEYKIRYNRDLVIAPIVKNITHIPAHNVRILIGLNDKIESLVIPPPVYLTELPPSSSMPGWRLFQRDELIFYPGEWQQQLILKFKTDAPDGTPQMFVSVDGSDLSHHYQQLVVFRRQSPED